MTAAPTAIRTIRWMVRDTFRQSLATKLFWVMLGITVLATVFCLSIRIEHDTQPLTHPSELPIGIPSSEAERIGLDKVKAEGVRVFSGEMTLGFGLFKVNVGRNRFDSVRMIQLWFAGILADTIGVLLALIWTAGFLPTFLEPQSVTVLLAKPIPRWALLVGKYLGVVLFVTLQAVLFVGGTWLGLGLATGVWHAAYWLAVPLLVINFAVFYAFSAFLAVCTRSTVVSIFGTLLFWLLCWGMNFSHHRVVGLDLPFVSSTASWLLSAGYWVLPKPLDMSGLFFDVLHASDYGMKVPELQAVQDKGLFMPELSVLASLLFAVGILAIAAREFREMDY